MSDAIKLLLNVNHIVRIQDHGDHYVIALTNAEKVVVSADEMARSGILKEQVFTYVDALKFYRTANSM